jgi:hypothetical integral membrane protein (TIGR02206 family)
MDELFALDYSGAPFQLFGTYHLVALSVVLLFNLWLILRAPRLQERGRRTLRYTLAAVLVVDELAWHLWNYTTGQWSVQTMLPLHLCSALVFLSALMLVTKSYAIYEFAYLLGIPGALQPLLTPDAGLYGFPHFRSIQVMVSHGAIVSAAVVMTAVVGYRPTWRSVKRVIIGGNLYLIAIMGVNALLGSNYLFVAHKPETASLLDVLPSWPWYIPIIQLLSLAMILLLYAPFALRDWRRGRAPAPRNV